MLDSCLDPIQALNNVTWPFSQVHSFTNIYCCFSFPGAKHRSQAGSDVQCKQNAVLSYISYLQVLEDIRPYSFYWRNVFICLLNNLLNEHIVFKSWMPIISATPIIASCHELVKGWSSWNFVTMAFVFIIDNDWSWLQSLDQVVCINY